MTHLNMIKTYVTWSMPWSCTKCSSSSVADMNRSPEATSSYKKLDTNVSSSGAARTKGGRCLKALIGLLVLLLESSRLASNVCSLCASLSELSWVYFGATKHTSMMRATPADINVYPNKAWTCPPGQHVATHITSPIESNLCGYHECLCVVGHGPPSKNDAGWRG